MILEKDGTCQLFVLIPYYNSDIQVLDRGEKIELLVDKTENLRSQVMIFLYDVNISAFNFAYNSCIY
jgi:PII-like signaling protein